MALLAFSLVHEYCWQNVQNYMNIAYSTYTSENEASRKENDKYEYIFRGS